MRATSSYGGVQSGPLVRPWKRSLSEGSLQTAASDVPAARQTVGSGPSSAELAARSLKVSWASTDARSRVSVSQSETLERLGAQVPHTAKSLSKNLLSLSLSNERPRVDSPTSV